jgi:hypothetical protein
METKLLRKPWLSHALCSLLSQHRQPKVAVPLVQLIQVEGKEQAIVSDRFHYIRAIFTPSCIESFSNRRVCLGITTTRPSARSLGAVNGGFLRLRLFHFKFTPDGQRVTLLVQAFDFIGAEQTYTCGEPADVHDASLVRRFKAVLPKGWSYKMDRGLGFSMGDYNECEIPPDQQALLDEAGWAFPTASGTAARPARRAASSPPPSGAATAGSSSSSAEWPTGSDAMLATQAADGASGDGDGGGLDGVVVSPKAGQWADERDEEEQDSQPFALVDSDGESSYSEDDEPSLLQQPQPPRAAAAATPASPDCAVGGPASASPAAAASSAPAPAPRKAAALVAVAADKSRENSSSNSIGEPRQSNGSDHDLASEDSSAGSQVMLATQAQYSEDYDATQAVEDEEEDEQQQQQQQQQEEEDDVEKEERQVSKRDSDGRRRKQPRDARLQPVQQSSPSSRRPLPSSAASASAAAVVAGGDPAATLEEQEQDEKAAEAGRRAALAPPVPKPAATSLADTGGGFRRVRKPPRQPAQQQQQQATSAGGADAADEELGAGGDGGGGADADADSDGGAGAGAGASKAKRLGRADKFKLKGKVKSGAKAMTGRYYQNLLAGGGPKNKKKRLAAKQQQQQQAASGAGWQC